MEKFEKGHYMSLMQYICFWPAIYLILNDIVCIQNFLNSFVCTVELFHFQILLSLSVHFVGQGSQKFFGLNAILLCFIFFLCFVLPSGISFRYIRQFIHYFQLSVVFSCAVERALYLSKTNRAIMHLVVRRC